MFPLCRTSSGTLLVANGLIRISALSATSAVLASRAKPELTAERAESRGGDRGRTSQNLTFISAFSATSAVCSSPTRPLHRRARREPRSKKPVTGCSVGSHLCVLRDLCGLQFSDRTSSPQSAQRNVEEAEAVLCRTRPSSLRSPRPLRLALVRRGLLTAERAESRGARSRWPGCSVGSHLCVLRDLCGWLLSRSFLAAKRAEEPRGEPVSKRVRRELRRPGFVTS